MLSMHFEGSENLKILCQKGSHRRQFLKMSTLKIKPTISPSHTGQRPANMPSALPSWTENVLDFIGEVAILDSCFFI